MSSSNGSGKCPSCGCETSHSHSPTTHSRALPPTPTHTPQTNLYHEMLASHESYSIPSSDNDISSICAISSIPRYLVYCGQRISQKLELNDVSCGWSNVFRCAITSGLEQLAHDINVQRLIAQNKIPHMISPGGMLTDQLVAMNSNLSFTPEESSVGVFKAKRLRFYDEMNMRLNQLVESVGVRDKSLLTIILICLGFYNQPEIVQDPLDSYDHSNLVAKTVLTFDALVKMRLEMGSVLNTLGKDLEARRLHARELARSVQRGKPRARQPHSQPRHPSHIN